MRVFVTGATGFIGFAVVRELLAAGHQVNGLTRSHDSALRLRSIGADVTVGAIEDVELIRRVAGAADAAVHTAFYHRISHIPIRRRMRVLLGGRPSGIVQRFLQAAVDIDRQTIETLGHALPSGGCPLAVPFATLALPPGQLATEDQAHSPSFFGAPRAAGEALLRQLAAKGIRTSAIRLPPIVHGSGDHGFAPQLIRIARQKRESAYVGDGANRWPSVHRLDAARLFRLALEKGLAGGTYHAVAEEGVVFRDIAGLIGRKLDVPVASKSSQAAGRQFGFLAPFVCIDNPTSSAQTRKLLGWTPTEPGLIADLQQADYFSS